MSRDMDCKSFKIDWEEIGEKSQRCLKMYTSFEGLKTKETESSNSALKNERRHKNFFLGGKHQETITSLSVRTPIGAFEHTEGRQTGR